MAALCHTCVVLWFVAQTKCRFSFTSFKGWSSNCEYAGGFPAGTCTVSSSILWTTNIPGPNSYKWYSISLFGSNTLGVPVFNFSCMKL